MTTLDNPKYARGGITDYRNYLKRVALVFRWREDMPSIQLAEWAEAKLPPGVYRVRYDNDADHFEIQGGELGPGALVAIWPKPGLLLEVPVPISYRVDEARPPPLEGEVTENPLLQGTVL
jgi:hypothetical protein